MDGAFLEAIRTHYGDVEDLTDCKCIMGKLVSRGLLEFYEKEELELPSVTTIERNQRMLDFVRRKGNSKFDVLVELLLTKECYRDFAISLHKACYGTEPEWLPVTAVPTPVSATVSPVQEHNQPCYTSGRPKMPELIRDLIPHIAARWKQFAYILDTPKHTIDKIHMNNAQLGVESCCTEFLAQWLESNCDATWNDVIRAVDDIGLHDVAEELTTRYMPTH